MNLRSKLQFHGFAEPNHFTSTASKCRKGNGVNMEQKYELKISLFFFKWKNVFDLVQRVVRVLELAGGVMDELANPMGPRKEIINNHCREFMQLIKVRSFSALNLDWFQIWITFLNKFRIKLILLRCLMSVFSNSRQWILLQNWRNFHVFRKI